MRKTNKYENQNSLQQIPHDNAVPNIESPYFAIFAEDEIGYAIPIEHIEEFILLPTTKEESFITIGEEKIPCISLRKDKNILLGRQAGYMICKRNSGRKIAIVVGGMSDCHRFFIKTLPFLSTELLENAEMDVIHDGIKAYHTIKINDYPIDVLFFQ